ncbi:bifunctional phosphoribosylaminoimidazolecarboxamide formyltransferase/IMP cyclohydrolase, partial [Lysinibacillus agricola]
GTKNMLQDNNVAVTAVDEVTNFPEILDGRVKTLHPMIHGGLLGKFADASHHTQMNEHGIEPLEIVCVHLSPFFET